MLTQSRVFSLRGLKRCTQVLFSSKKVLPKNFPDDSTANFSQFGSSQVRCKVSDRSHPLHISKSLFSTSKKVNHDGDPDDSKSKSSQFGSQVHFKVSDRSHPLPHISKGKVGDHFGLQQNHVWDEAEIKVKMEHLYHHTPVTVSDKVMHGIMRSLYHSFNFITGYEPENTEVKAMEWRLIVLESVAGVAFGSA